MFYSPSRWFGGSDSIPRWHLSPRLWILEIKIDAQLFMLSECLRRSTNFEPSLTSFVSFPRPIPKPAPDLEKSLRASVDDNSVTLPTSMLSERETSQSVRHAWVVGRCDSRCFWVSADTRQYFRFAGSFVGREGGLQDATRKVATFRGEGEFYRVRCRVEM
jgi:hypothetical protein